MSAANNKKLSTQAGSVFETGRQQEQGDFSAERTDLHSKIGELTVKLDFVVKKSKLTSWGVKISMDGRGRWMDNVFIERLWRSIRYEEIYLREHAIVRELEQGVHRWFEQYNTWRPHESLSNQTPLQVYRPAPP